MRMNTSLLFGSELTNTPLMQGVTNRFKTIGKTGILFGFIKTHTQSNHVVYSEQFTS